MNVIKVENVKKEFRDGERRNQVIKDVSFSVEQGQMVAIIGPSGSGKSTLLKIIGNVIYPDSGEIYVEGKATSQMKDKERCRLRNECFGYIVQDFALIEDETMEENIMLPTLYHRKKNSAKIYKERLKSMAEELKIYEKRKTKIKKLSGGERQRISIIRSQICDQNIILADEPTGALDQENTDIVIRFFEKMAQNQKTVIVVTHDERVAQRCDKIFRLEYGTLTEVNKK